MIMSNKLTDKEVVKALECCTTNGASCKDCPAFVKVDRSNCKKYFRGALDLINRQKAENERLKEFASSKCEDCAGCTSWKCDCANIEAYAKAEAYKECIEKIHTEIAEALNSNYKVKAERMAKPKVDMADEFISYCEGKIAALRGIDDFADNLLKEFVGEI